MRTGPGVVKAASPPRPPLHSLLARVPPAAPALTGGSPPLAAASTAPSGPQCAPGASRCVQSGETLPVEVMSAEEAQKGSRRRAKESARLPDEDPRRYHEGGQLLQEPGGAGGQAGTRRHQAPCVLPVAGGLPKVQ